MEIGCSEVPEPTYPSFDFRPIKQNLLKLTYLYVVRLKKKLRENTQPLGPLCLFFAIFIKTHFDIEENRGLGDDLRLLGLLLMVSLQPLLRDPLLLLAFLLIGASKEVDVIVFLLSRSRLGRSRLGGSRLGGWFPTLELANARLQGED